MGFISGNRMQNSTIALVTVVTEYMDRISSNIKLYNIIFSSFMYASHKAKAYLQVRE